MVTFFFPLLRWWHFLSYFPVNNISSSFFLHCISNPISIFFFPFFSLLPQSLLPQSPSFSSSISSSFRFTWKRFTFSLDCVSWEFPSFLPLIYSLQLDSCLRKEFSTFQGTKIPLTCFESFQTSLLPFFYSLFLPFFYSLSLSPDFTPSPPFFPKPTFQLH